MSMTRKELDSLARAGAVEHIRRLLKHWPHLLDEFQTRHRVPKAAREELAEATSNGSARGKAKWTAERRAKFMRTVRRKQRASKR